MNTHSSKNILYTVAIFSLVFLGVFLYWNNRVDGELVKKLNLTPIPEKYTELYFEEHSLLPKTTKANEEMVFSFSIHNVEGEKVVYPYKAYFRYPSGYQVIFTQGTTTIESGETKTITVYHRWLSSRQVGRVVVELVNLDQYIDFILPNNN